MTAELLIAACAAATVAAVLVVAHRVDGLRAQMIWTAIVTVAGLGVAVLLFVDTMFLTPHDARYAVLLAGYALVVGGWSAWFLGRRALRRVEATERARRDLVASVSHDLRTPITSLRLLAEAIDDDIVDADTRAEYVRRIGTHVRTLGALIEDLFELSRLEAGDVRWAMEPLPLDALVTETVDALRPQADAGGVAMRTELAPAVPAARVNPEQLQRVLFNLIHNAIRHTPQDGSVTVRTRALGLSVEVEVADSGAGIPEHERARVFEPFFQGGGVDERGAGGAGLGLAISRAIVEAHGGRLWLADGAGPGTRVRFSVPAAP